MKQSHRVWESNWQIDFESAPIEEQEKWKT